MPHSTTKLLLSGAFALAASAAVASAATTNSSIQATGPSASAITANEIASLDATNPVLPGQETLGTNSGRVHLSIKATYANDYWFRYRDVAPNRFNLMVNDKLDVDLGDIGHVYVKSFADFSSNIKKPYDNHPTDNLGFRPSSDLTDVDLTFGYHYDLMQLVGLDTGYTNYITPITYMGTAHNPSPQISMQEWFFKAELNDQRFLGDFALHPYVFVGLDFDGAYYTAGAGQYWEAGLNPCYTVPNTGGLKLHPYANISFISNEKRLATSGGFRDGYLGTTVGFGVDYPLNTALNIPAAYGTYTVGAFVEGVFAGSHYQQPAGSYHQATVAGMSIGMTY